MAPLNEHLQSTVILSFICTNIHFKLSKFYNKSKYLFKKKKHLKWSDK